MGPHCLGVPGCRCWAAREGGATTELMIAIGHAAGSVLCPLWRRSASACTLPSPLSGRWRQGADASCPPLRHSCFLSSSIVGTAGLEPLPLAPQSVSCVPAQSNGLYYRPDKLDSRIRLPPPPPEPAPPRVRSLKTFLGYCACCGRREGAPPLYRTPTSAFGLFCTVKTLETRIEVTCRD